MIWYYLVWFSVSHSCSSVSVYFGWFSIGPRQKPQSLFFLQLLVHKGPDFISCSAVPSALDSEISATIEWTLLVAKFPLSELIVFGSRIRTYRYAASCYELVWFSSCRHSLTLGLAGMERLHTGE